MHWCKYSGLGWSGEDKPNSILNQRRFGHESLSIFSLRSNLLSVRDPDSSSLQEQYTLSIFLSCIQEISGKVLRKLHVFAFSPRGSPTPPFESSCTQRDQRRFVPLFLIRFAHKNAGRGSSAQRVPDSAVRIFSGPTKYKKHKAFALCLIFCGPEKIRTPCLLSANEALYQVSYWPNLLPANISL